MACNLYQNRDQALKITLDIDYREQSVINILTEKGIMNHNLEVQSEFDINIKNLIIGDFVFKEDESVHYIIERKTINDLCASIKDGRFTEQKRRLSETIEDQSKIIFVIEGDRNKILPIYKIPKSTIDSAIQNLIFKHKYKVIFSDSIEETIENIMLLYKKLTNNDFESKGSVIKTIKKSDYLNQNIFTNMLCAIPGVSTKIAKIISYKYKNMNELIQAYNEINNEINNGGKAGKAESLLANIQLSEKRKLGMSLSIKIYKSLFESSLLESKDTCLL
jgi:ERCC4-type nuclease